MTLPELARMRGLKAVPAYPIVVTGSEDVYLACLEIGLPVMWEEEIFNGDLRPLHGLPLWLIGTEREFNDKVRKVKPKSLWITGCFGFQHRISELVGERIMICNT